MGLRIIKVPDWVFVGDIIYLSLIWLDYCGSRAGTVLRAVILHQCVLWGLITDSVPNVV